ncbi:MAG: SHOCT domain-containing protein [Candidatus Geothermincolia bacterium]
MYGLCCVAGLSVSQLLWQAQSTLWWFWVSLVFFGALMLIVAVSFALYGVTHCPHPRLPGLKESLKAARHRCSAGEISHEDYRRIRRTLKAG